MTTTLPQLLIFIAANYKITSIQEFIDSSIFILHVYHNFLSKIILSLAEEIVSKVISTQKIIKRGKKCFFCMVFFPCYMMKLQLVSL